MSQEQINSYYQIITEMVDKYKENDYMLQRINNHISGLPDTLETELANYEKRVNRQNFLTSEQQIFIQVFLSKHQYYYLPNNNYFYEYNGKTYTIVKEDDIIHKLLSSISKERVLLDWKYKTKTNIIKQIKDRHLFSLIPETDTIQNILGLLCPAIFSNKNIAKYFLTIIGDNILKKNSNHIFIINQKIKKMLSELDYIACASIGFPNTIHNFMTKYHENYSYDKCRLINMNDKIQMDGWKNIIRNNGLDLLCIAVHYSNRYVDSDKFIETNTDEELKSYAYYLKNTTNEAIVNRFCLKYIKETSPDEAYATEWKNLHFVWKQFLAESSLPNMIYSNTLKTILKDKYKFDEQTDSFLNITSKYLPVYSDFIKFWNKTVTVYQTEQDSNYNELEIDEICTLFKHWANTCNETLMTNGNINEENVIKILKHFFHDIEIIDDKYVLNVSCILWNKNDDIFVSFDTIKENIIQLNLSLISFDEAYNYYYKYCKNKENKMIVSKRFFEKYVCLNLSKYIAYEKCIVTDWILSKL